MNEKYQATSRNWYNILFLCCWARQSILWLPIVLLGKIPYIGGFNYAIYDAVIIFLVLLSFNEYRYFKLRDIIICLLMIVTVLVSYILTDNVYLR